MKKNDDVMAYITHNGKHLADFERLAEKLRDGSIKYIKTGDGQMIPASKIKYVVDCNGEKYKV